MKIKTYLNIYAKPLIIGFLVGSTFVNIFQLIENIVIKIALIIYR